LSLRFTITGLGRAVFLGANRFDPAVVETPLAYASVLASGRHVLAHVVVVALDKDLRAEWPVAGMPVRT
jgi:hypothetical protein